MRDKVAEIIGKAHGETKSCPVCYAIADKILALFREEISKLKPLSDEEIRSHCLGENLYWIGEVCETAADNDPVLMPQFRRIAQAQLDAVKKELEGK